MTGESKKIGSITLTKLLTPEVEEDALVSVEDKEITNNRGK